MASSRRSHRSMRSAGHSPASPAVSSGTPETRSEDFFNHNWRWGRRLGSGHFGTVFRATSKNTSRVVAVKTERHGDNEGFLRHEYEVYLFLHARGTLTGIPTVLFYQRHTRKNVMVMSYLGPSLWHRVREYGKLSEKSVCMIGIQLVSCFERIHNRGYLHRDVKPDNILTSLTDERQIYLSDFGLAKFLRTTSGNHIPMRDGVGLVGTFSYASINSHHGKQTSRRDDLESLGYTLMYLLEKSLPWGDIRDRKGRKRNDKIARLKERIVNSRGYLPRFLQRYLRNVTSLGFTERPNYAYLRSIFEDMLTAMNEENDSKFEWVDDSSSDDGRLRRANTAV